MHNEAEDVIKEYGDVRSTHTEGANTMTLEDTTEQKLLFGRYEVLRPLGEGGSGSVYLVRHHRLQDDRALKCIRKSDQKPRSIQQEAKLLKHLNHPGIPIIYDLEEDDKYLYIVEEYIRGESLQTILSESNFFSKKKKVNLMLQLCDILTYLHEQKPWPVVYQDLKPEHIFVCNGQVRLVDFGIASWVNQIGQMSGYGTPGFAAPEQYTGTPGIQADLYALGAVMYYLLTGQSYTKGAEKNLRLVTFGYGKAMRLFLQTCLAKNPAERFSCAREAKSCLLEEWKRVTKKKENEHLHPRYRILAVQSGVGATHFSIALLSYLRAAGGTGCYEDRSGQNWLQELLDCEQGASLCGKQVCYRDFCGKTEEAQGERSEVFDYGTKAEQLLSEIEPEDRLVLILGTQKWQERINRTCYERFCRMPNLLLVCSYGRRKQALHYAKLFGRKVYCFPLEEDVWKQTRERRRFFRAMLSEEKDRSGTMA